MKFESSVREMTESTAVLMKKQDGFLRLYTLKNWKKLNR